MHDYDEYLAKKRRQYGSKFDASKLAFRFVPFFESGQRIKVEIRSRITGEVFDTKFGTVGATTGPRPTFLLMHNVLSVGSSELLSEHDRVIAVKVGSRYVDIP